MKMKCINEIKSNAKTKDELVYLPNYLHKIHKWLVAVLSVTSKGIVTPHPLKKREHLIHFNYLIIT